MPDSWFFFPGVFGQWLWEHGDSGTTAAIAPSKVNFLYQAGRRRDAINEGCQPPLPNAVFPPDFQKSERSSVGPKRSLSSTCRCCDFRTGCRCSPC
jgi:hypothetical protein